MSVNMVDFQTSRVSPFSTPYEGHYVNKINSNPPLYSFDSSPVHYSVNSRDGIEYKTSKSTIYFSSKYAVSIYKTHHHQNIYSFTNLLSDVGGLGSALFAVFMVVGRRLNLEFLKDKIARALYFVKTKGFIKRYSTGLKTVANVD